MHWLYEKFKDINYDINKMAELYERCKQKKIKHEVYYHNIIFTNYIQIDINSFIKNPRLNINHKDFYNDIGKEVRFYKDIDYLGYVYLFYNFIEREKIIANINEILEGRLSHTNIVKQMFNFIDAYMPEIQNDFNSYRMVVEMID